MALFLSCVWALAFPVESGAQEPRSYSDNLVRVSMKQFVDYVNDSDRGPLQAFYLQQFARQLADSVLASMSEAPDAITFPGSDEVLHVEDLVAIFDGVDPDSTPFDPGVLQGVRELIHWYDASSWHRGDAGRCFDGRAFALGMDSVNSWWQESPEREAIASRLTHTLGLFHERSSLPPNLPGVEGAANDVCMAGGREGEELREVHLTLEDFSTSTHVDPPVVIDNLTASRSPLAPQTQIDLRWQFPGDGPLEFEIQRSPDGETNWAYVNRVTRAPDEASPVPVPDMRPGSTHYFRVGPPGKVESAPSNTAQATTDGPRPGCWQTAKCLVPAVGAVVVGVLLLTRDDDDDDDPRSGTVIVRIPIG